MMIFLIIYSSNANLNNTQNTIGEYTDEKIYKNTLISSNTSIGAKAQFIDPIQIDQPLQIDGQVIIPDFVYIKPGVYWYNLVNDQTPLKPGDFILKGTRIKSGTVIPEGVTINNGAIIESGVVINNKAILGSKINLAKYTIQDGVRVKKGATINSGVYINPKAIVEPGVKWSGLVDNNSPIQSGDIILSGTKILAGTRIPKGVEIQPKVLVNYNAEIESPLPEKVSWFGILEKNNANIKKIKAGDKITKNTILYDPITFTKNLVFEKGIQIEANIDKNYTLLPEMRILPGSKINAMVNIPENTVIYPGVMISAQANFPSNLYMVGKTLWFGRINEPIVKFIRNGDTILSGSVINTNLSGFNLTIEPNVKNNDANLLNNAQYINKIHTGIIDNTTQIYAGDKFSAQAILEWTTELADNVIIEAGATVDINTGFKSNTQFQRPIKWMGAINGTNSHFIKSGDILTKDANVSIGVALPGNLTIQTGATLDISNLSSSCIIEDGINWTGYITKDNCKWLTKKGKILKDSWVNEDVILPYFTVVEKDANVSAEIAQSINVVFEDGVVFFGMIDGKNSQIIPENAYIHSDTVVNKGAKLTKVSFNHNVSIDIDAEITDSIFLGSVKWFGDITGQNSHKIRSQDSILSNSTVHKSAFLPNNVSVFSNVSISAQAQIGNLNRIKSAKIRWFDVIDSNLLITEGDIIADNATINCEQILPANLSIEPGAQLNIDTKFNGGYIKIGQIRWFGNIDKLNRFKIKTGDIIYGNSTIIQPITLESTENPTDYTIPKVTIEPGVQIFLDKENNFFSNDIIMNSGVKIFGYINKKNYHLIAPKSILLKNTNIVDSIYIDDIEVEPGVSLNIGVDFGTKAILKGFLKWHGLIGEYNQNKIRNYDHILAASNITAIPLSNNQITIQKGSYVDIDINFENKLLEPGIIWTGLITKNNAYKIQPKDIIGADSIIEKDVILPNNISFADQVNLNIELLIPKYENRGKIIWSGDINKNNYQFILPGDIISANAIINKGFNLSPEITINDGVKIDINSPVITNNIQVNWFGDITSNNFSKIKDKDYVSGNIISENLNLNNITITPEAKVNISTNFGDNVTFQPGITWTGDIYSSSTNFSKIQSGDYIFGKLYSDTLNASVTIQSGSSCNILFEKSIDKTVNIEKNITWMTVGNTDKITNDLVKKILPGDKILGTISENTILPKDITILQNSYIEKNVQLGDGNIIENKVKIEPGIKNLFWRDNIIWINGEINQIFAQELKDGDIITNCNISGGFIPNGVTIAYATIFSNLKNTIIDKNVIFNNDLYKAVESKKIQLKNGEINLFLSKYLNENVQCDNCQFTKDSFSLQPVLVTNSSIDLNSSIKLSTNSENNTFTGNMNQNNIDKWLMTSNQNNIFEGTINLDINTNQPIKIQQSILNISCSILGQNITYSQNTWIGNINNSNQKKIKANDYLFGVIDKSFNLPKIVHIKENSTVDINSQIYNQSTIAGPITWTGDININNYEFKGSLENSVRKIDNSLTSVSKIQSGDKISGNLNLQVLPENITIMSGSKVNINSLQNNTNIILEKGIIWQGTIDSSNVSLIKNEDIIDSNTIIKVIILNNPTFNNNVIIDGLFNIGNVKLPDLVTYKNVNIIGSSPIELKKNCTFDTCTMRDCVLPICTFKKCALTDCIVNISSTMDNNTQLINCSFTGNFNSSNIYNVQKYGCKIFHSILQDISTAQNTTFESCELKNNFVIQSGAKLINTKIESGAKINLNNNTYLDDFSIANKGIVEWSGTVNAKNSVYINSNDTLKNCIIEQGAALPSGIKLIDCVVNNYAVLPLDITLEGNNTLSSPIIWYGNYNEGLHSNLVKSGDLFGTNNSTLPTGVKLLNSGDITINSGTLINIKYLTLRPSGGIIFTGEITDNNVNLINNNDTLQFAFINTDQFSSTVTNLNLKEGVKINVYKNLPQSKLSFTRFNNAAIEFCGKESFDINNIVVKNNFLSNYDYLLTNVDILSGTFFQLESTKLNDLNIADNTYIYLYKNLNNLKRLGKIIWFFNNEDYKNFPFFAQSGDGLYCKKVSSNFLAPYNKLFFYNSEVIIDLISNQIPLGWYNLSKDNTIQGVISNYSTHLITSTNLLKGISTNIDFPLPSSNISGNSLWHGVLQNNSLNLDKIQDGDVIFDTAEIKTSINKSIRIRPGCKIHIDFYNPLWYLESNVIWVGNITTEFLNLNLLKNNDEILGNLNKDLPTNLNIKVLAGSKININTNITNTESGVQWLGNISSSNVSKIKAGDTIFGTINMVTLPANIYIQDECRVNIDCDISEVNLGTNITWIGEITNTNFSKIRSKDKILGTVKNGVILPQDVKILSGSTVDINAVKNLSMENIEAGIIWTNDINSTKGDEYKNWIDFNNSHFIRSEDSINGYIDASAILPIGCKILSNSLLNILTGTQNLNLSPNIQWFGNIQPHNYKKIRKGDTIFSNTNYKSTLNINLVLPDQVSILHQINWVGYINTPNFNIDENQSKVKISQGDYIEQNSIIDVSIGASISSAHRSPNIIWRGNNINNSASYFNTESIQGIEFVSGNSIEEYSIINTSVIDEVKNLITNKPIIWTGEINQDFLNTYIKNGDHILQGNLSADLLISKNTFLTIESSIIPINIDLSNCKIIGHNTWKGTFNNENIFFNKNRIKEYEIYLSSVDPILMSFMNNKNKLALLLQWQNHLQINHGKKINKMKLQEFDYLEGDIRNLDKNLLPDNIYIKANTNITLGNLPEKTAIEHPVNWFGTLNMNNISQIASGDTIDGTVGKDLVLPNNITIKANSTVNMQSINDTTVIEHPVTWTGIIEDGDLSKIQAQDTVLAKFNTNNVHILPENSKISTNSLNANIVTPYKKTIVGTIDKNNLHLLKNQDTIQGILATKLPDNLVIHMANNSIVKNIDYLNNTTTLGNNIAFGGIITETAMQNILKSGDLIIGELDQENLNTKIIATFCKSGLTIGAEVWISKNTPLVQNTKISNQVRFENYQASLPQDKVIKWFGVFGANFKDYTRTKPGFILDEIIDINHKLLDNTIIYSGAKIKPGIIIRSGVNLISENDENTNFYYSHYSNIKSVDFLDKTNFLNQAIASDQYFNYFIFGAKGNIKITKDFYNIAEYTLENNTITTKTEDQILLNIKNSTNLLNIKNSIIDKLNTAFNSEILYIKLDLINDINEIYTNNIITSSDPLQNAINNINILDNKLANLSSTNLVENFHLLKNMFHETFTLKSIILNSILKEINTKFVLKNIIQLIYLKQMQFLNQIMAKYQDFVDIVKLHITFLDNLVDLIKNNESQLKLQKSLLYIDNVNQAKEEIQNYIDLFEKTQISINTSLTEVQNTISQINSNDTLHNLNQIYSNMKNIVDLEYDKYVQIYQQAIQILNNVILIQQSNIILSAISNSSLQYLYIIENQNLTEGTIKSNSLVKNCTISSNVVIESHVTFDNCTFYSGSHIPDESIVKNSIIKSGVTISPNAVIQNSQIENN